MDIKHLEVKRAFYADPENVIVQCRDYDNSPWESWESPSDPHWTNWNQWRIKPRTITINGIEVPEPMRTVPKIGEQVWLADTCSPGFFQSWQWKNIATDTWVFDSGMLHSTKEAAIAHAKALILASGGKVEK